MMLCDELKTVCYIDAYSTMPVYGAKDVDEAIAELKRENERLVKCCKEYDSRQRIDERIKFNGAKQLRATKRALWMARAERAKTEYNHWILIWHCELNNHLFFINKTRYKNRAKVDRLHYPWEWRDIWSEVERKCRAKAEEYK